MIRGGGSGDLIDTAGYIGFERVAGRVWGRKVSVLLSILAGLGAGWAVAWLQKPVYRAVSALEIQLPNDDYLNRRQLDPSVKPGPILLEPFLQTELRLLQSDTLFRDVIAQLNLAAPSDFNLAARVPTQAQPRESETGRGDGKGPLLEEFRDRLEVRMVGQTQIAEVAFEAGDPDLAATVVNCLVDKYRRQSQTRRAAVASDTADLLAGQLKELDAGLTNAQKRLRDFVAREKVVGSLDKESLAETKLRQMQGAVTAANESRVAEETRLNALGPGGSEPVETETLARYRLKLTELRQKKAEFSEVMTPTHSKVKQVQAEIDEVEKSLEGERGVMMNRARRNLQAAVKREGLLQKRFDQQLGMLVNQTSAAMRFGSLKQEMDTYQLLHNTMLQKVKEARLAAAIPASSIIVVDRAVPPYRPVRPKKALSLALGGVAGLFLGLLLSLWPSTTHDPGVNQTAEPFRDAGNRPPLGVVPFLQAELGAVVPLFPALALDGRRVRPELTSWEAPDSAGAESFGRIAARLWPLESALWPKVVSVTSGSPGEGKTTVACNLALTAARQGRRVLLVDADYMNPSLHEVFGAGERAGFLDVLANGERSPLPIWKAAGESGLRVLLLGGASGAPLPAASLRNLIADLKREFDTIIFDTPSLVPSDDAIHLIRDAIHLIGHTDGAVLVAKAGEESEQLSAAVTGLLAEHGIAVLGLVSNNGKNGGWQRLSRRGISS